MHISNLEKAINLFRERNDIQNMIVTIMSAKTLTIAGVPYGDGKHSTYVGVEQIREAALAPLEARKDAVEAELQGLGVFFSSDEVMQEGDVVRAYGGRHNMLVHARVGPVAECYYTSEEAGKPQFCRYNIGNLRLVAPRPT